MTQVATRGRHKIGWFFSYGGGHVTQFQNFQDCYPSELADDASFFPLHYDHRGDWIGQLPGMPGSLRFGRSLVVQVQQGLKQTSERDTLFFAGGTPLLWPLFRRYPSYLYVDFTISRLRDLSPWYDDLVDRNPLVASMRSLSTRLIMGAARGIFAMSAWVGSSIAHDFGVASSRLHVVLPGANLKRWHLIDRSGHSPTAPKRILFVGADFKRKGGEEMLSWAERTRRTDWELDILAEPGKLPAWVVEALGTFDADGRASASLAPRLPRVRVHCGLRANSPEVLELYEQADVFCLPTLADGTPVATLEAMATGLPVLASAIGGIPELIRDGETGLLVQPGNVDDLSAKLDNVLEDRSLRVHLGQAARQSCEQYFNVERQIRQILEVMDRDRTKDGRI